jgi:hypothetical protein
MVEDDGRIRVFADEIGHFRDLRMKQPRIEAQSISAKTGGPSRNFGSSNKPEGKSRLEPLIVESASQTERPRTPRNRSPAARKCLQHRVDAGAELELREADNARADAYQPIAAARVHRGDAVDEFRFPHRREVRIAVGPVHGVALNEHSRANITAGA